MALSFAAREERARIYDTFDEAAKRLNAPIRNHSHGDLWPRTTETHDVEPHAADDET